MPRRMSNSDRIARAAAEAEAADKEKKAAKKAAKKTTKKATKKATKKTTRKTTKKSAVPQRRKIVWAVGRLGADPVATYPYKEKAAAEADAKQRGDAFSVKPLKVPMEDPPEPEAEAEA